jgi:predicted RNA-binding Zn-ribbon protein involved in translation (DUF1610 family)
MTEDMDSTFQGDCSSCGMRLELPREYIGQKVECPGCGNKFIVTDPEASDGPAFSAPEPEPEPEPEIEASAVEVPASADPEPAKKTTAPPAGKKKVSSRDRDVRRTSRPASKRQSSGIVEIGTTPDALMENFKGSSLKKVIVFTLTVHVVVLLGSSVFYFYKLFTKTDISEMDKDKRIELAVKDASSAIRKIAEEYELNPQEISDSFNKGSRRASAMDDADSSTEEPSNPETPPDVTTANQPTNAIERELSVMEKGPSQPISLDQEEDLFK